MKMFRIALLVATLGLCFVDTQAQNYRWDYFNKLITPRRNYPGIQQAVVFAPCKVLVAGGLVNGSSSSFGQPTASCEIIDVCCSKVTATGSMNFPRSEHCLLLAPDSNVVAISGMTTITDQTSSVGTHTATVELYNRATGTWSVIGSILTARRQAQAVFINSTEIYITGGRITNLGTLNTSEIFNITTGTSQYVANYFMPINMHVVGTSSIGSTIIAGGRNGGTNAVRTRVINKYVRATDSYTQLALLPDSVRSHQIRKLFDGRLLISGGVKAENSYRGSDQIVLENNDAFNSVNTMSAARWGHAIGQISNDSCIFIGGNVLPSGLPTASCEWYSLGANKVSAAPSLPIGLASFSWASVPLKTTGSTVNEAAVIVIGGAANNVEFSNAPPRDTIFILRRCANPDSVKNTRVTGTCLTYKFYIDSVNICREPTYVRWSYGDGGTTIGQPWSSVHGYSSGGSYLVKATLYYANCADSLVLQRTISISAQATIAASPRLLSRCMSDTGVVLHASGGVRYRWSPGSGLSDSTSANPTARPTKDTKYYVYGWTADSCVGVDSVIVRVSNGVADAGADVAICATADSAIISVNVSGIIKSVRWTPKAGLACDTCAMTKAKPLVTTKYAVIVVDTSGCVSVDTIQVSIRSGTAAKITAGPSITICASSDSIPLNVTPTAGVRKVLWTPNIGIGCDTCAKTKAKPKATVKYTVYVTDSLGCLSSDTILVKVGGGSSSIQSGPPQFICFKGDSAIINIRGRVMSVQWQPAAEVSCPTCPVTVAKPTATRYFSYTAVDSSGCTALDSIKVTVLPKSTADIAPDTTLCGSSALTMNVYGSFQTLQWAPTAGLSCANCPSVLVTPTPGKTVTYYVTAHNGNSSDCDSRDSIKVRFAPGVEGQLIDQQVCPGDSIVVTLRPFGGRVNWSNFSTVSCDTCKKIVIKPTKSGRIVLTGDSLGCISRDTMDITVAATTLSLQKTLSTCSGRPLSLGALTNASSVTWSPAIELSCTDCPNPIATPTQTRTYYVTAGKGACAKRDSVVVTVKPAPIFTAFPTDTALCKGGQVQINVNVTPAGTTIDWNANSDLSCYNCPNPIAKPSSNDVWYYATLHTPGGCDSSIAIHIRTVQPPVITVAAAKAMICDGDSVGITVTTSSSAQYAWTSSTGVSSLNCDTCQNVVARPRAKTTYVVRARTASGCETVDSVTIDVTSRPTILLSHDTAICRGTAVQLHASGAAEYRWDNDPTLSCTDCGNPIARPTRDTTIYVVHARSALGIDCWQDSSITITTIPCAVKMRIQSSPIGPFIACDSGRSTIVVTNEGDVVLRLDSITVATSSHAKVNAADLSLVNVLLPMTLNPVVDTLRFPLYLIPDQSGPAWVDLQLHFRDSVHLLHIPFTTYKRDLKLSLPPVFLVPADTVVAMTVDARSTYWSELQLHDSVRIIVGLDASTLEYRSVSAGPALPSDWTVSFDSANSSHTRSVFVLRGKSVLSIDGALIIPLYHTLLPISSSATCTVAAEFPALRIDCADQESVGSTISVAACAINIRRVQLMSGSFALYNVQPNPSRNGVLSISYGVGYEAPMSVRLYSVNGEEVQTLAHGVHSAGVYELQISTGALADAEYLVVLNGGGHIITRKVLIMH